MLEEQNPKPDRQHIERPEINKGWDSERSYEKLHSPGAERSNIKEGYQPVVNITSTPPDGGSGIPDKSKDS